MKGHQLDGASLNGNIVTADLATGVWFSASRANDESDHYTAEFSHALFRITLIDKWNR